jgi:hypothetical protein
VETDRESRYTVGQLLHQVGGQDDDMD